MEPEEFSREIGQILGSGPISMDDRQRVLDAMGEADSFEELPKDIQQLLSAMKQDAESRAIKKFVEENSESRASQLSTVERRIIKKPNICEQCRLNDDPRKVPVHPNCDCDVVTDSIEQGVADPQSRFLKTLNEANMVIDVITGDKFAGDLILDPETVAIMDAEDVRFSDIARWLEIIEPYLNKLDRAYDYVSIAVDDDNQEAVAQVQETIQSLTENTQDFAEAIKSKKLWFALAKAVAI